MKFGSRLRFLTGLVAVVLIVGLLFMYLSYSLSHITSRSAVLASDAYDVTTEYAGVLKQTFVQPGDTVKEGDALFEIKSPSLTTALESDRVSKSSLLFSVAKNGNIILLANAPGTVRQINFTTGSYIEANDVIASVSIANTRYVTAKYLLNAPDYARIDRDSPVHVTLPDNTQFDAKVFDITLEQDNEQIYTVVKARFSDDAQISSTFNSGTPVSTSWQLTNSNWQDTVFRFLRSIVEPKSRG